MEGRRERGEGREGRNIIEKKTADYFLLSQQGHIAIRKQVWGSGKESRATS